MELDKKLVAAIGTAVTKYLMEEEAERAVRERAKYPQASMWSQSGRQDIMRNRQMWQMRIVPG
jgi:hypothetical protein